MKAGNLKEYLAEFEDDKEVLFWILNKNLRAKYSLKDTILVQGAPAALIVLDVGDMKPYEEDSLEYTE